MTEGELESQVIRGELAKQILESPLLVEAFDAIRAKYIAEIESSTTPQETWMAKESLRALSTVTGHIRNHISTGKLAQHELTLMQRLKSALYL